MSCILGNKDLICNMLGTSTWVENMKWPYSAQWKLAKNTTWYVDGAEAGYYKSYNYLSHLIVENAGHMVRDRIRQKWNFRRLTFF
jgi:carboxypeptidase C (cathepsin A)